MSITNLYTVETTPSPFIEGTYVQYAWDSTSLEYMKRCPRLYYYEMIAGWKASGENIHLRFGLEYHQGLHDYELAKAAGADHEEAVLQTVKQLLIRIHEWDPEPHTKSEENKSRSNLVRTVIWYLDHYKDDPAKTVMLSNGKPALEVSFRFNLEHVADFGNAKYNYVLCGHLDRIVEYEGSTFVMDRKTTASTPSNYYFDQFDPHNQMSLYSLAGRIVLNSPLRGVIIDTAQVAVGFSRFVRSFTLRGEEQLTEWLHDLQYIFAAAETYAAEEYWPMNDTSCDKYGGCRYREICRIPKSVRRNFLESNFIKGKPWNPLEVR